MHKQQNYYIFLDIVSQKLQSTLKKKKRGGGKKKPTKFQKTKTVTFMKL